MVTTRSPNGDDTNRASFIGEQFEPSTFDHFEQDLFSRDQIRSAVDDQIVGPQRLQSRKGRRRASLALPAVPQLRFLLVPYALRSVAFMPSAPACRNGPQFEQAIHIHWFNNDFVGVNVGPIAQRRNDDYRYILAAAGL